jgi:ABC-type transport system involved in cytochrome bd biosynthesis fused ATPase/permease subunit
MHDERGPDYDGSLHGLPPVPGRRLISFRSFDPPTRRRLLVFAALLFVERVALVAAAFVFVTRGLIAACAMAAVFAVFFAARGMVRSSAWGRVVGALHARMVDGLLERDLLRSAIFADDEPEAAVLEGLDSLARLIVDHKPAIVADLAASIVVAIFFLMTQSMRALLVGALALSVTAAIVALSRSRTIAESSREWIAYRPVIERLVATLHARLEIVGNGSRARFRDAFARDVSAWQIATIRSQRVLGAVGRAPLLLGGAVVVGIFVLARASTEGVTLSVISDAAVFGAALPPFAGLVRGLHEARKATARAAPIATWLEASSASSDRVTPSSHTNLETIEWRGVSIRYDGATADALSEIDIAWKRGGVLAVMGDNGSGKSTLLKSLLGVGAFSAGEIFSNDEKLSADAAWRSRLAYLPQRPYVGERLTAREVLSLVGDDLDEANARSWLERVGAWSVLEEKSPSDPFATRVGVLSVGERQRLALARFFSRDRDAYLLDEPDANLDAAGVTMIATTLRELAAKKMVIVAAHTPELVASADSVVALEKGRVKK